MNSYRNRSETFFSSLKTFVTLFVNLFQFNGLSERLITCIFEAIEGEVWANECIHLENKLLKTHYSNMES